MKYAIAVAVLACAVARPAGAQRSFHSGSHVVSASARSGATHSGAQGFYQSGRLIEMTARACSETNDADPAALLVSDAPGAQPPKPKRQCPEYKLESKKAVYVIRPVETRRPVLLPIGENAQFRIKGDHLVLKVKALDGLERDYKVLSVTTPGAEVAEEIPVW